MSQDYDEFSLANWRTTYETRLKEKGYESILDFLKKYQAVPYDRLGVLLGVEKDDCMRRLRLLQQVMTIKHNCRKDSCKDVLVRYLHQYNVNWKRKHKDVDNRMEALGDWRSFLESCCDLSFQEAGKLAKQIWDFLEEHVVPNYNWLPESSDDPLITAAFDKFWPENM